MRAISRSRSATASRRWWSRPRAGCSSRGSWRAAPQPIVSSKTRSAPACRSKARSRGGQGRIRSPHRPAARLLPVLADRHAPNRPGDARRQGLRVPHHRVQGRRQEPRRSRGVRCSRRSSARSAAEVRKSIVAGAVITGRVASVREFGAFVDLGGGVQGLLHVSEMGWSRVSDPSQLVKPGDEITVKVLRVDDDKQKISLGLKQLAADPWSTVARHVRGWPGPHRPRDARRRTSAPSSSSNPASKRWPTPRRSRRPAARRMGAPGRAGNDGRVRDPEHRAREEADRRRAPSGGLGAGRRRGAAASGDRRWSALTGKVERHEKFGVFVFLAPGRTGLIPMSETGVAKEADVARAFPIGADVEVVVLEVEPVRPPHPSQRKGGQRCARGRRKCASIRNARMRRRPRVSDRSPTSSAAR